MQGGFLFRILSFSKNLSLVRGSKDAERFRFANEFVAEDRIGDADKGFGSLPMAHALEIDFAVFGDDVLRIGSCRSDGGAFDERRANA